MPPVTIGGVLALLVLVAAFVLVLVNQLDVKLGVMLGGLALARLIP
mgnify:CR=1 FL=1